MSELDLDTFKPESAKELADGIIVQLAFVLGTEWKKYKKEITQHVKVVAQRAFETRTLLAAGKITPSQADFELHGQEYYLNNIVLFSSFIPYVIAQKMMDVVFSVINAAIENWTGIDLLYGSRSASVAAPAP